MKTSDLVVTGFGHAEPPCDSTRYLKVRKQRKFMGLLLGCKKVGGLARRSDWRAEGPLARDDVVL